MCWGASPPAVRSRGTSPWCWQEPRLLFYGSFLSQKTFTAGIKHFQLWTSFWHRPSCECAQAWLCHHTAQLQTEAAAMTQDWLHGQSVSFPSSLLTDEWGRFRELTWKYFFPQHWIIPLEISYICSKRSLMLLNAPERENKTQTGECFCFTSVSYPTQLTRAQEFKSDLWGDTHYQNPA